MGRKEGKKRHRSGDIFPMYQGDHEHYGGKHKIKARTAVSEKKKKWQEDYGRNQTQSSMCMG